MVAPWRLMRGVSGRRSPPSSIRRPIRSPHLAARRGRSRPSSTPSNSRRLRARSIRAGRIRKRRHRHSGIFCGINSAVFSMGSGKGPQPAARRRAAEEAPALGPAREQQERLQRAAAAWRRLDQAQRRLQRLWSDALGEAARAFVSRVRAPAAPPTPEALHALYDAWIDCAEEAYAGVAHGEAFGARARGRFEGGERLASRGRSLDRGLGQMARLADPQ